MKPYIPEIHLYTSDASDKLNTEQKRYYGDAVAKGVQLLQQLGLPWQMFAGTLLNMSHPQKCILGHLFGSFTNGYYMLGWGWTPETPGYENYSNVYTHGFRALRPEDNEYLTELWQYMRKTYVEKNT